VAGADYIVDVLVSNYICMADESTLVKFGAVHATAEMKKSDFYIELARSFARNFSRDINKFFAVELVSESGNETVTTTSKHSSTYTGVALVELSQEADYIVGEYELKTVNFQVVPHTIIQDGEEVIPFEDVEDAGTVQLEKTDTYVGNGYKWADTEYFTMGERGDVYRQMGYPRTIRTKYMVDPTVEYSSMDIAFYFVGRGVDAQKSEKHLTIICPDTAKHTAGDIHDEIMSALVEGRN
jgi:hypothetical protein